MSERGIIMSGAEILIYEEDGDRTSYNRTYIGIKIKGLRSIANFSDSWGWNSPQERQKARAGARRLAQKLATITGLEIVEDFL